MRLRVQTDLAYINKSMEMFLRQSTSSESLTKNDSKSQKYGGLGKNFRLDFKILYMKILKNISNRVVIVKAFVRS